MFCFKKWKIKLPVRAVGTPPAAKDVAIIMLFAAVGYAVPDRTEAPKPDRALNIC